MNTSAWFMISLDYFKFECLNVPIQKVTACCEQHRTWRNYQEKDYLFEEIKKIIPTKVAHLDAFVCGFSPNKYPGISIFLHPQNNGLAVAGFCSSKLEIEKFRVHCTNRTWNKKDSQTWNFGYIQEFCVEKGFPPSRLVRVLDDESLNYYEIGLPYPFEDISLSKKRRIADRFNRDKALEYMENLGFPLCDADLWENSDKMFLWHY